MIFLRGLEPADLRVDPERREKLERRLRPLLGNLTEVHEGMRKKEIVKPKYGPYWDMAITSWRVPEVNQTVYSLTGCELVQWYPKSISILFTETEILFVCCFRYHFNLYDTTGCWHFSVVVMLCTLHVAYNRLLRINRDGLSSDANTIFCTK